MSIINVIIMLLEGAKKMEPGESKEINYKGDYYTVTRGFNAGEYTVWKDGQPTPYNVNMPPLKFKCECYRFLFKNVPCRHKEIINIAEGRKQSSGKVGANAKRPPLVTKEQEFANEIFGG